MRKLILLATSILLCEGVGLLATPFTLSAIPIWYMHLHKPFFSPPNWLFGPVWTTLFLLMGISLFLVMRKSVVKKRVKIAVYYFLAQLLVNFLWSFLFFGLKSPILGLVDIIVLFILIILTMKQFLPVSRIAFWLLVPYVLWVGFATVLNISIVVLN